MVALVTLLVGGDCCQSTCKKSTPDSCNTFDCKDPSRLTAGDKIPPNVAPPGDLPVICGSILSPGTVSNAVHNINCGQAQWVRSMGSFYRHQMFSGLAQSVVLCTRSCSRCWPKWPSLPHHDSGVGAVIGMAVYPHFDYLLAPCVVCFVSFHKLCCAAGAGADAGVAFSYACMPSGHSDR
jgi:hypothetical protein